MCMLFVKPKNLTLPEQYLKSLQENNADGVSCHNLETGELFQTLDYIEAFAFLEDSHNDELVVHFRFGTSGQRSLSQLHGWNILNDEYAFFHNGVLSTFKGDSKLGLSDTQQFVNFVNDEAMGFNINDVVDYLENYELGSRFLIVKKSDNSIIIPDCANWEKPILINNIPVKFSNGYAIDYHLLQDEGHTKPFIPYKWNSYGFKNKSYKINSGFYDDGYDNDLYDELTDNDQIMIDELENIMNCHTRKDLIDFITVNPDIVATYLLKGDF